jgi:hypothetical protein
MNDIEYLQEVLKSQTLDDDGKELKALHQQRKKVERLLHKEFGDAPTIRYGGSLAKGTMIKESYDLDLPYYFPHDDNSAGTTLKEIYESVAKTLEKEYFVERKTSALRLRDCTHENFMVDFHIDVVPGRYIDGDDGDVFLFQAAGNKERLRTNLDVHIKHVRDSGVVDAIRFIKLWRVRNGIVIKQFVLDLLTIKLLKRQKSVSLDEQLRYVWEQFRDRADDLSVEDPANPEGNDLSDMIDQARSSLSSVARSTLALLDAQGWEAIFGKVEDSDDTDKQAALRRIAASVTVPTKPWHK